MINTLNYLRDFFLVYTNQLTQLYEKMIPQTFLLDYFLIVESQFLIIFGFVNFYLGNFCKNQDFSSSVSFLLHGIGLCDLLKT